MNGGTNTNKLVKKNDVLSDLRREGDFLACGNVDTWFLLILTGIVLFGMIMSFSASSVYAEMYHDDSTYFFKRYCA